METTLLDLTLSNAFSVLEILLITTVGTVAGGIVMLAKWFYNYLTKTNKERADEIKSSVQVQTELKSVIEHNNYLVEQLPERIQEKLRTALVEHKIHTTIESHLKKEQQ